MARDSLLADRLDLSDDIEKVFDWFYENELTDGLPIIPPTEERVERMVRASGHDPDEVLSILPPRQGAATSRLWRPMPSWPGASPSTCRSW